MRIISITLLINVLAASGASISDDSDHQDVDMTTSLEPEVPVIQNFENEALVPLLGTNPAGSRVRTNAILRNGRLPPSTPLFHEPCGFNGTSTYDLFVHGLKRHEGTKREKRGSFGVYSEDKYGWLTYKKMDVLIRLLGNGLVNLKLHGPIQDSDNRDWRMVGIYSEHRIGWTITELAAARQNITLVPIYDTADASFVWSILMQTNLTTIIASIPNAMKLIDMHVSASGSSLKTVIIIGDISDKDSILAKYPASGLTLVTLGEVYVRGEHGKDHIPSRDDISTICFTSGTTGEPKGALITHGNLIAVVGGTTQAGFGLNYKDTHFAYLPPAHIFERIIDLTIMYMGGRIGYYSGDMKQISRDVRLVAPTIFAGVPRVLEKTIEKIDKEISVMKSGWKRRMVTEAKTATKPNWRSSIVSRIMRQRLGGNLRMFLSGGGFLSASTQKSLERLFQVPVVQGYGMTETTGGTLVGSPLSKLYEVVGVPFACAEVKIVPDEDEEDGFEPPSKQGELWVRGPSVFKGYFGKPEATAEILSADGFVRTGDIVEWINEEGEDAIRIVGRKKENFKLASGNYIVPTQYEAMYKQCALIAEIMVEPARDYTRLVALVNIRRELLEPTEDSISDKEQVLKCIHLVEEARKIPAADRIGEIFITETDFGPEGPLASQLYTPTMKLKRGVVRRMFEVEFSQM